MKQSKKSLAAASLLALAAPLNANEPIDLSAPEQIADGFATADPAEMGFDEAKLAKLDAQIAAGEWGNVHALLIERHGKLVLERYYTGPDWSYLHPRGTVRFGRTSLHDIRSNGKTLVALALGVAQLEGHLPDLDAPLPEVLPHRADLLSGPKAQITLRHLLTMTAGLAWDEWSEPYGSPGNSETGYREAKDPNGWALEQPLVHEPGSTYAYSHASTQLVVEAIEDAVGEPFETYLKHRVLIPLGIRDVGWAGDEIAGLPDMAGALRLNARDMTKLGRLLANGGRWNGVRIISSDYVEEMLVPRSAPRPIPGNPPDFVEAADYGLQTWIFRYSTETGQHVVPAFSGHGEQRTSWLTGPDVIVTLFAGNYGGSETTSDVWMPDRMLVEAILPAL